MLSKLALSFKIGAAISDEHAAAVKTVGNDFASLGKSVRDLNAQQRTLDRFGKSREAFLKAAAGASEARRRLVDLKAEYARAPSDKLGAAVRSATDAFEAAKTKAFQQKRALDTLKKSLTDTGVATSRLTAEKQRLGKEAEATRIKLERFNAVQAKRAKVGEAWGDVKSSGAMAVGSAAAFGAAVAKPAMAAAKHQDTVRQIAITGEVAGGAEESQLGAAILEYSRKFNQSGEDLSAAVGALVAEGASVSDAARFMPAMAQFATATRANAEDVGKLTNVLRDTLKITDMERAYSQLAVAGKEGSFEIPDIAKWAPKIASKYNSIGFTGHEAVSNMASRMQIARLTAATADEAGTNFQQFLAQLMSPKTVKAFADKGVDLKGEMLKANAKGLDPLAAGIGLIMAQTQKESPALAAAIKEMQAATKDIADPEERGKEIERRMAHMTAVSQQSVLGEIFRDQQSMSYLLAELQNGERLTEIRAKTQTGKVESGRHAGKYAVAADFDDQMELSTEKAKQAGILFEQVMIGFGKAIEPLTTGLLDGFNAVASGALKLAEEFPNATARIAQGVTVLGAAFVGAKVLGFAAALWRLGGAMRGLGAAQAALAGPGVFARFGAVIKTAAMGAGRAVLFLGRAFFLNPIGLAITAVAAAGYLLWKNWDTISAKAGELWEDLKTLGAGIRDSLGAAWESLKTSASAAWGSVKAVGAAIVDGIRDGIRTRLAALKESVLSIGDATVGWFKDKLGIKSPSRVFAGLGASVGEGAALGITSRANAVGKAVAGLATAATAAFAPAVALADLPALPAAAVVSPAARAPGAAVPQQVVNHNTFHITQAPGEDSEALARRVATLIAAQQGLSRRSLLGDLP